MQYTDYTAFNPRNAQSTSNNNVILMCASHMFRPLDGHFQIDLKKCTSIIESALNCISVLDFTLWKAM